MPKGNFVLWQAFIYFSEDKGSVQLPGGTLHDAQISNLSKKDNDLVDKHFALAWYKVLEYKADPK